MIYKLGLLGVTGRMGTEIAGLLREGFRDDSDLLELADAVASSDRVTSVEGVGVRKLGEPPREPVHAWIDFSRPAATLTLLRTIETPVVIGTTGFDAEQVAEIEAYARRQPVLLAPNMSPGMNLVMHWLRALPPAALLGFDVVLEEAHHRHKKDAPSGTAKAIQRELERTGNTPAAIHVTRAGGLMGTHTVKLISDDEEIVIEHRVLDRKVFARGALLGALFLLRHRQPGLYSMRDVFLRD